MVDLTQFKRNRLRAGEHGIGFTDRLKFLYWTYARRLPLENALRMKLKYESVGTIDLMVRTNKSDTAMASEVFEHECYGLKLKKPPERILDLGGNAGFTTVYFSKIYPQAEIATVEPIPSNLKILHRNIALNACRAKVFEGAISTESGKLKMALSDIDSEHQVGTDGEGSLEVNAYTVDDVMAEMGWDSIDLVKLDIEGYESVLLRNNVGWLEKVGTIVMEYHPPLSISDVAEIAAPHGFTCREIFEELLLLERQG